MASLNDTWWFRDQTSKNTTTTKHTGMHKNLVWRGFRNPGPWAPQTNALISQPPNYWYWLRWLRFLTISMLCMATINKSQICMPQLKKRQDNKQIWWQDIDVASSTKCFSIKMNAVNIFPKIKFYSLFWKQGWFPIFTSIIQGSWAR